MSFWKVLRASMSSPRLPASMRPRRMRRPTSMCTGAASLSARPSAALKPCGG